MVQKDKLGILSRDNSVLLIIDVQEKFRPVIFRWNELIRNINKLVKALQILKIPVLLTEQYTKGLGKTCNEVRKNLLFYRPIGKKEFNCFNNKVFLKQLRSLKKKDLIICGIESHVCIINTLLGAISKGFNVHLVVDAISSRKESDLKIAIERAKQSGAFLTTTEMVIFQLMGSSKIEGFKKISKLIK